MADKPTTGASDRDPYFSQQIQALQGQIAALSSRIAALEKKVK